MAGNPLGDTSRTVSMVRPIGAMVQNAAIAAAATLTPPTGANVIILSAEGADIRYRFDGTAATATTGFPLADGLTLQIGFVPGVTFSVIEQAVVATIHYQWGVA